MYTRGRVKHASLCPGMCCWCTVSWNGQAYHGHGAKRQGEGIVIVPSHLKAILRDTIHSNANMTGLEDVIETLVSQDVYLYCQTSD